LLAGGILAPACVSAEEKAAKAKPLDIYFIDTEGGAATLIVTPAGESVLVDPGYPGDRDPPRIARVARETAGLEKIDHFISTHWHSDHVGGLLRLVELIPVRRFYDRGLPEKIAEDMIEAEIEGYRRISAGKSVALKPGDKLQLESKGFSTPLEIKILASNGIVLGEKPGDPQVRPCDKGHPSRPEDTSDNALSVAFLLTFGRFKFFDGADLTWNVEHKLACPANLPGEVDVFQVNHHGFAISNNPLLLAALSPRVAIMNNGPTKGGDAETFARLEAVPGLEDVFQLHRNLRTKDSDNAPPELISSSADEKTCKGGYIKLSVDPSGESFAVSIPAKGTTRTYRGLSPATTHP
jgi:beta-lactamase superfamily II metal-dependent hydrolase